MKVIVYVDTYDNFDEEGELIYDITVRKCPPNYKPQEGEYVVELQDYTDEDIKEYFPVATRMPMEAPFKKAWEVEDD